MLEDINQRVCAANKALAASGIVIYTWGNVSEIDPARQLVVIKPSGIPYDELTPEDMVVVNLISGDVIEGHLNPSSDTKTHIEIYKAFHDVSGICHTHSPNATVFAQAGMEIRCMGTTHADYFYGDVTCTRALTEEEVNGDYELNTGLVIVETIKTKNFDPLNIPAILVKNHGPFTFGKDAMSSVETAVVLETVADMNIKTMALNPHTFTPSYVLDKHFNRKHGINSYYGQKANDQ